MSDKPWAFSRGPILATELEVQRAEAIVALLTRPIAILPAKAGDEIRPFAIGLFNEIKALIKPTESLSKLRRATSGYVHSRRYYLASAQPDAMRHDLDGLPAGEVSAADRAAAQGSYFALKQAHAPIPGPAKAANPETPPPSQTAEPAIDASARIRAGFRPRKSAGSAGRVI